MKKLFTFFAVILSLLGASLPIGAKTTDEDAGSVPANLYFFKGTGSGGNGILLPFTKETNGDTDFDVTIDATSEDVYGVITSNSGAKTYDEANQSECSYWEKDNFDSGNTFTVGSSGEWYLRRFSFQATGSTMKFEKGKIYNVNVHWWNGQTYNARLKVTAITAPYFFNGSTCVPFSKNTGADAETYPWVYNLNATTTNWTSGGESYYRFRIQSQSNTSTWGATLSNTNIITRDYAWTSTKSASILSEDSKPSSLYRYDTCTGEFLVVKSGTYTLKLSNVIGENEYKFTISGKSDVVPAPEISYANYNANVQITAPSNVQSGYTIRYTVGTSNPTGASGTLYTSSFLPSGAPSSSAITIKAVGYYSSNPSKCSEVTTFIYHFKDALAKPVISLTDDGKVQITNPNMSSDFAANVQIRYSPTADNSRLDYVGPFDGGDTGVIEAWNVYGNGQYISNSTFFNYRNPDDPENLYYVTSTQGLIDAAAGVSSPKMFDYDASTGIYSATVPYTAGGTTARSSSALYLSTERGAAWASGALAFTQSGEKFSYTDLSGNMPSTWHALKDASANIEQYPVYANTRGYWDVEARKTSSGGWEIRAVRSGDIGQAVEFVDWNLNDNKQFPPGTSKFFYISAEQNDARVTPEWELTLQDDGKTYTFENPFMVIPAGEFRIRQIDKSTSGTFTITDWGASSSGQQLYVTDFVSGTINKQSYDKKLSPAANAGRGWMWNLGYTMANVEVTPSTRATNSSDLVIYYMGDYSAPRCYVYFSDDDRNSDKFEAAPLMTKLADGWFYYVADSHFKGANVIINNGSSGGSNQTATYGNMQGSIQCNNGNWSSYSSSGHSSTVAIKSLTLTASVDFTKPSTLTAAPIQGVPYVALMGSRMVAAHGDSETLSYVAKLNANNDNTAPYADAYTNGYIQFTEDGKIYRYGDSNAGRTDTNGKRLYYVDYGTDNQKSSINWDGSNVAIAQNKVMNSTMQPPRNPVRFRAEYHGDVVEFTSDDITFVPDDEPMTTKFTDSDGNSTKDNFKVRAYRIKDISLLGDFKLFSGYGAQTYGSVFNGLSMYDNWGLYDEGSSKIASGDKNGAYSRVKVSSGEDIPLSGAGSKHYNGTYDRTNRGIGHSTIHVDGDDNYGNEDNKAGVYFGFDNRTYCPELTFYYALEKDQSSKGNDIHYAGNDWGSYDQYVHNTGRNYSWLNVNFTPSGLRIELDKVGVDAGRVTYSINESGTGQDQIQSYYVQLYKCDIDGNNREIVSNASVTVNDAGGVLTVDPRSFTRRQLSNGWYIAVITAQVLGDNNEPRPLMATSKPIQIFGSTGYPEIEVVQIINEDTKAIPGSVVKEYTFNARIYTEIDTFVDDNYVSEEEYEGTAYDGGFNVQISFPFVQGAQEWYFDEDYDNENAAGPGLSEGNGYTTSYANGVLTITFDKNLFPEHDDICDIIVTNCVPFTTQSATIGIKQAMAAGEMRTATDQTTIDAPVGVFSGEPMLTHYNTPNGETFNSVSFPEGKSMFAVREEKLDPNSPVTAILSSSVYSQFLIKYELNYVDENVDGGELWVNDFPQTNSFHGQEDLQIGKVQPKKIYNLPYYTSNGEIASQKYNFRTGIIYTRAQDGASSDTKYLASTILYDSEELISPREGIQDLDADVCDPYQGDYKGKDWRVISTSYIEKYGGLNTLIENAHMAVRLATPGENVYVKFDLDKQKVLQGGMFALDQHETATEKAPGYMRDNYGDGNLVWWNTQQNQRPPLSLVQLTNAEQTTLHAANTASKADVYHNGNLTLCTGTLYDGCGRHDAAWDMKNPDGTYKYAFWAGNEDGTTDEKDHPMHAFHSTINHHNYRGWTHGEYPTGNTIDRLFGGDVKVSDVFAGVPAESNEESFKFLRETIVNYIVTEKDPVDNGLHVKINEDYYTKDDLAQAFMGFGALFVDVPHVNHETWWETNTGNMFSGFTGNTGNVDTDLENLIRIPGANYFPATYDLRYEYPMLTSPNYVVGEVDKGIEIKSIKTALGSGPSSADITDITARATGEIPFNGTNAVKAGTPTSMDEIAAETASISISYDRATAMLSVRSSGELGTVAVTAVSGAVVKMVPAAKGCNALNLDLSGLANGAYIVTVDGGNGTKILR